MDFDALFTSWSWTTLTLVHLLVSGGWYVFAMLAYNRVVLFMAGTLVFTHALSAVYALAVLVHRGIAAERDRYTTRGAASAPPQRRAGAYLENLLGAVVALAVLALAAIAWYIASVAAARTYPEAPGCTPELLLLLVGTTNATCANAVVTTVLARTLWQEELALVVLLLIMLGTTMALHLVDVGYAAWLLLQLRRQNGYAQAGPGPMAIPITGRSFPLYY